MITLSLLVLRCSDLEQSREFYEHLGLLFSPEQHDDGPQHWSCTLGDTVLELYPSKQPQTPILFGLQLRNAARTAALLESLGIEVRDVDGGIEVLDPDGNKVHLK